MNHNIFSMVKNKYHNVSEPIKASVAFAVCSILQKSLATITLPIFTRLLTTEQYGVYSIYTSWYSIIQIFATLNLYLGVFNNGMVKFSSDRDRFHSAMLGLSTTVTIFFSIVYIINADFWDSIFQLKRIFIILMIVELLFVPAFQFWSSRQRFEFKYKELVFFTLVISILSPIFAVLAVFMTEYKAEARVFAYVLVEVVVSIYFYIRTLKKSGVFFVKDYWKFGLKFNIPLIPHYLSGVVLNQADRIMINNMVGTGEAAIYSVAYSLAYMVSIVTTAINNSFLPYTYQKLKKDEIFDIRKASKITAVIVAFPIVLVMFFGPELIAIFSTDDYYEAIWVIPPVAMSVFITYMYGLFVNIEFYFEKNKFIMIASCIGAGLNILLNRIFINLYGYLAAGYTTLACYIMFMFLHYIFYLKVIRQYDLPKIYDLKFFVTIVIMVFFVMILMVILYNNIILRYCLVMMLFFIAIFKRNKIRVLLYDIKMNR